MVVAKVVTVVMMGAAIKLAIVMEIVVEFFVGFFEQRGVIVDTSFAHREEVGLAIVSFLSILIMLIAAVSHWYVFPVVVGSHPRPVNFGRAILMMHGIQKERENLIR